MSQVQANPFKYSSTNKRYYTYDYYLKEAFGGKCAKITLDCGLSCPNIDGTLGFGGCIYCSGGSSSLNCRNVESIKTQYERGKEIALAKWKSLVGFIPYMQAYTNTHTTPENLDKLLSQVSSLEGAVALAIATRADCLENEKLEIINKYAKSLPFVIELGLQSSNDETARLINRLHDFDTFKNCVLRIRKLCENVKIGVHIINGLPQENYGDMIKTARDVADLHPDFVKIHLLHVIKNTPLARLYERGEYTPISREDYIKITCDQIELLPPDTVIERVTGDGIEGDLLAPLWSIKKTTVINDIDKELFNRGSYQGKKYISD